MVENLIPRQHPFSIFQIFQLSWFAAKKGKENFDFLEISKKLWIFHQKSQFLTYVIFSLSAKFNRFFIILGGGVGFEPGKPQILKSREKCDFLWFFSVFQILVKSVILKKPPTRCGERLGMVLFNFYLIYVLRLEALLFAFSSTFFF